MGAAMDASGQGWRNVAAYALLVACLVGVHYVLAANPDAARSAAQAAVFAWPFLGGASAAGFVGLIFWNLTSLRGLWDRDLGFAAKALVPLTLGAALGAINIAVDRQTHLTTLVAAQMHLPSIHIAFPLSIPIYFGGAILVTILYYFVLLPPLYWLIAKVLKRNEPITYWTIGTLLALVEPLTQDLGEVMHYGGLAVPGLACDLVLNFGQVALLRRSGLVAAILFRVGYYAVWHVIYGLMQA